eukprot:54712_1
MGNDNQPINPAPVNSTVIQQEESWVPSLCSFCQGPQIPRWPSTPPGKLLIQSGLSAQAMQQEIDAINAKAVGYVEQLHDTSHYLNYFAILLMIAGGLVGYIIGVGASYRGLFAFLGISVGVFFSLLMTMCIRSRHITIWNQCLNHVTNYIQSEVSPRYQSIGLAWTIRQRTVTCSSGKDRYYMTYNDICVTPPTQQVL